MTIVMTEFERDATSGGPGDDIVHYFCCDPNWSMCGLDLTGDECGDDDNEDMCVVCEDLRDEPCADSNCPDRYDA